MATVEVRVFAGKAEAQKYAQKMNEGARVYRYEVKPYYIAGTRKIQGWKVRKVRRSATPGTRATRMRLSPMDKPINARFVSSLSLGTLKKEARETATWRGHKLGTFKPSGKYSAIATCKRCGAEVVVNSRPAPNEIDIMGEAVALSCKTSR